MVRGVVRGVVMVISLLQVKCYDWDEDSSNDLIGFFDTNLAELQVVYS